jgi:putative phosphoesterase
MKLGILSDTHNNADNTKQALAVLRGRGVDRLVHCGDLTTPDIIALFDGWHVDFVFGNMDRQQGSLEEAAAALPNASIGEVFEANHDGTRIAAYHGHVEDRLYGLIYQGGYDVVLHGHTHRRRDDRVMGTRVINPGALGGTRHEQRSLCVLDLADGHLEVVKLDE